MPIEVLQELKPITMHSKTSTFMPHRIPYTASFGKLKYQEIQIKPPARHKP
jgi:hypothetical protein